MRKGYSFYVNNKLRLFRLSKNMNFAKFNHVHKTGVKQIDDEHEHLIDMINELILSFNHDNEISTAQEILSRLENYANYHFENEEKYLKKVNYKHFEEHKEDHNNFRIKIKDLKKRHSNGDQGIAHKILNFLGDWIHNCQLADNLSQN